MERPLKDTEQESPYMMQALVPCLLCMIATPQGKCPKPPRQLCFLNSREAAGVQKLPVVSLPLPLHDMGLVGDLGGLEL